MAKKVNWTFTGLETLQSVHEYIDAHSEESADKFIDRIFAFCENFSTFPASNPICRFQIFQQKSYRCAIFEKQYIIVYSDNVRIDIVAVIHASRDVEAFEI
jgi:plasmid stabilization system protein ParE